MEHILKQNGEKVTRGRLAILDVFSKNKKPLSAEMIFNKLKENTETAKINLSTIFRTLNFLYQNGILKKVDLRKESVYFEMPENHHHHLVCTKCDRIEDFQDNGIEKLLMRIVERSHNFRKIKDHSFELFGVCNKCI